MLSKIFGKTDKNEEDSKLKDLKEKISKMNITDMKSYIDGKFTELYPTEEGLVEVLARLTSDLGNRKFIDTADNDIKKKRAFELVLSIAKHPKITLKAIEEINNFLEVYKDLIFDYDRENKQIYEDKIKKSIDTALEIISAKASLNNKMKVLK